jgi:hypothetical protein
MAVAYEAERGEAVAERADSLRAMVDNFIQAGKINPWCGICRAPRGKWSFEDAALIFQTLGEAERYLRQLEEQQSLLRRFFEQSRN